MNEKKKNQRDKKSQKMLYIYVCTSSTANTELFFLICKPEDLRVLVDGDVPVTPPHTQR